MMPSSIAAFFSCLKVLCFYPSPTCVFGLRAIESKEQGVREEKEMAIADVCNQNWFLNMLSLQFVFPSCRLISRTILLPRWSI
ncbi:hypothetical protein GLYMA_13G046250v4 [Glycine max]|nr:hypothetical protein GLYMA_13G046250v4 [Glycine max]KAH1099852.1 hypothetical protein GYH30_035141 [Glycine max]